MTQIFDYLAKKFTSSTLTDIHLREDDYVWVRDADILKKCEDDPIFERSELIAWLKQARYEDQDPIEYLRKNGGDDDFSGDAGSCRYRANAYLTNGLLGIALRRLGEEIMPFASLGIPARVLELADKNRGMFLVTGGTGSGKTTTLAAILDHYNNTRAGHIITAEDPIELVFQNKKSRFTQRSVGLSADANSFSQVLKAALREDPDVIMVGELRDRETMNIALSAAETGHMVFGTLHTNGAYLTIDRIASMYEGAEREQALATLASVLTGIVSQVKIPGIDGRPAIATEVLVPTNSIRVAIRKGLVIGIRQDMQTNSSDGQILLNKSLTALVHAGRITREDAFFYSLAPDELEDLLR